ncbi:hypothetical protein C9J85_19215 [Haloferax sp. wsp5]|nr:hypothetical protein C9J85_19215 [Haloferax sp. wsp5]
MLDIIEALKTAPFTSAFATVSHCIPHVQSTFNTLVLDDGFVKRPTGPGLGIEVDEGYVRERTK